MADKDSLLIKYMIWLIKICSAKNFNLSSTCHWPGATIKAFSTKKLNQ